jgi:hypothetical protein
MEISTNTVLDYNTKTERGTTMNVRLLNSSDANKYWNLRLEALEQNPEAFATSYEEAIQRENPDERATQNLSIEGNFTFGAFDDEELVGVVTLV